MTHLSLMCVQPDAVVRMKDGATVIIGRFMQKKRGVRESGIPGLMDISFPGMFCKVKDLVKSKNELVIFLASTLMYGSEGL